MNLPQRSLRPLLNTPALTGSVFWASHCHRSPQWPPISLASDHTLPTTTISADQRQCLTPGPSPVPSSRGGPGHPTHRPWQAEFQQPILYHVDAGIRLAWPEDIVPLAEPLEDHVPAQLQEEWLLKVAQHPVVLGGVAVRHRRSDSPVLQGPPHHPHPDTDRTFLSMYSTSEGRWELARSPSVRSASSTAGGGSFRCSVGVSFWIRRILVGGEGEVGSRERAQANLRPPESPSPGFTWSVLRPTGQIRPITYFCK